MMKGKFFGRNKGFCCGKLDDLWSMTKKRPSEFLEMKEKISGEFGSKK